jgi:hypothetical protein
MTMAVEIERKYQSYPDAARRVLLTIRGAIHEVAAAESLGEVVETLKWGEPSFLTKQGSAVRIDWKSKQSDSVSVYFNCNTKLADSFKELYGDTLKIVGNREIVLPIEGDVPISTLKLCLSMSLRYHAIKHLPLLGG